jgi:glycosyltransferase involved in cell wall biosynthesis
MVGAPAMNIWYLQHYAKEPPHGHSGRPNFLATVLTERGHRVLVVAASDHHLREAPVPAPQIGRLLEVGGSRFVFLPARAYRGNGLRRTLNMLDYARGLDRLRTLVDQGAIERPDVVIASSAHLLLYPRALRLARRLDAAIVFEVRDLWPLSLVEIAGVHPWHPMVRIMERIERRAYRTADAVVSLLPNALPHMEERGLDASRFHWIPNGVWAAEWEEAEPPLPREHREAFEAVRASGKLAVVYTGSHGPPNALGQVLDLIEVPAGGRPYHFLLIGEGIQKIPLRERAQREGIDFVTFLPQVSKAEARAAIRAADVCFIGWQDRPIYRYGTSANKLFEYMMAGRPILHAISQEDDPVQRAGAGITVPACAPADLDQGLRRFAAMDPGEREGMGQSGRKYVLEHYEWSVLGRRYEEALRMAVRERRDRPAAAAR